MWNNGIKQKVEWSETKMGFSVTEQQAKYLISNTEIDFEEALRQYK